MEGTKSTLSPGTKVRLSDERSAILTRSARVRHIEGPIVSLPQEIFLTLLSHADPKTIVRLCETKREFYELCQDEAFWKNRTKEDYNIVVLPQGFRSWQDYYIYLTKPREIPVMMYKYFGEIPVISSVSISYRTQPKALLPTLVGLYNAHIPLKTPERSETLAIFAMTAEYPYNLTHSGFIKPEEEEKGFMSEELWHKLYITGIDHISITLRDIIRIRGFITTTFPEKYTELPYFGGITPRDMTGYILSNVKEMYSKWMNYREFDTSISIPALGVRAEFTLYGSIFEGDIDVPIVNVIRERGELQENEQGFYPFIPAEVEVKFR